MRRDAEPLVRFLRDTVSTSGRTPPAKPVAAPIVQGLTLTVEGEDREGPVTPDAIHDALLAVGTGSAVILSSAPETYIQTVSRDGSYLLEMRQGDDRHHF